jgi:DNA-directed RNA polymerase specialized sigma subunit
VGLELGVSQMQVSRLERRALKRLKQIVESAPREAN